MNLVKKGTAVIITAASVVENEHEYQALLQLPERGEESFLAVDTPAVVVDITFKKNSDEVVYVVAQNNAPYVVEAEAFEVAPQATPEEFHKFFYERFSKEVPNLNMIFAYEAGMNLPENL